MGDFSETPGWRSPPHPQHQCSGAFARGQGSEKYLLPSSPPPAQCEKVTDPVSYSWRKDTFFFGLATLWLPISMPFKSGANCRGGESILERPSVFPSFNSLS